jgi:CHAD domain-containing protein
MNPADPWIAHLREHVRIALDGTDPEGVHQVRVASRRLDAWLVLGRRRMLRDDLSWIRRAVADARDLDVLAQRDGLSPALVSWLVERRRDAQAGVREAMADPRTAGLLLALAVSPPIDEARARRVVARLFSRALLRGDEADDLESLHALRRALRRLRFALEHHGERTDVLVEMQDALGALNDDVVLLRWIGRYPGDVAGERAEIERAVERSARAARKAWKGARDEVARARDAWNSS